MIKADAKRHATHLCDVWSTVEEHIGVIESVRGFSAKVSGHPEYGTRTLLIEELETNCKIKD